ncbi:MAG: hypothetical protein Q8L37_00300 [Candidatus Gottesmanbacteria bacterium]|nr:hypothetical protein [Candidatus Gottesmanbacteria bacterium]
MAILTIKPPNEPHEVTKAESIRKFVADSSPGTVFDVEQLATQFNVEQKYVGRLLEQMKNATVTELDTGEFARMADDVPFVGSRELRESLRDHQSTPDAPGSHRNTTHRGAGREQG